MTTFNVNQSRVYVNLKGSGEPLLLLHGVPDTSEVWDGTIAEFSNNYRCIAPDLPGFGRTQVPRDFDYSLENLAGFVDQLLFVLKIDEPIHMVIHDIGGIVGLAFATAHPEKVKSLTIMDTTFFADHKWHATARVWRKPFLGELTMHLMGHKQFSAAMKKAAPVLTDEQIQSNYDALTFRNRRMILRFYRALDPVVFKGTENQLKDLTNRVPTQVIWGAMDSFLPAELAQRFTTKDVHVLDNCGHWPMLENPNETHRLVRNLIAQIK